MLPDRDSWFRTLADTLDGIDVGMCLFDDADCSLIWNRTFLKLFPEHDGHVYRGEPYSDNLRRFYGIRLGEEELPNIESYIEAGIARHRTQSQPFIFEHRGLQLRVSSSVIAGVGRIRLWRAESIQAEAIQAEAIRADTHTQTPLNLAGNLLDDRLRGMEMLDRIPDGLMICGKDGVIEWANEPFVAIYGLHARSLSIGVNFATVYQLAWAQSDPDERVMFDMGRQTLAECMRFVGAPFELPLPGDRFVRVIARPAEAGTRFYTHVDITELKRQQRLLAQAERIARHAAEHDALTGLMSRSMFLKCLKADIAIAAREATALGAHDGFAVHFIDLLNFKPINDSHGHAVGDRTLVRVAQCIARVGRESDIAARLGGDEFVLLQRKVRDREQAIALARRLLADIGQSFRVDGIELQVGASLGIAFYPEDADDPEELLRCADMAMYRAKSQRISAFCTYDAVLDDREKDPQSSE